MYQNYFNSISDLNWFFVQQSFHHLFFSFPCCTDLLHQEQATKYASKGK